MNSGVAYIDRNKMLIKDNNKTMKKDTSYESEERNQECLPGHQLASVGLALALRSTAVSVPAQ